MTSDTATEPGKPRWWLRYAGLWLVPCAILIALLAAEVILRMRPELLPESAQIKRLFQTQTKTATVGDPYLGFTYRPGYKEVVKSLDFEFLIESDEHGLRNDSPWPERADIVVVGDSMVYGWGVELEESWVGLLRKWMPERAIINLSMPGASPQQYTRYFDRFGVALKPKVAVFGLFPGNDLVGAELFERWVQAGSPGNFEQWRFGGDDSAGPFRSLVERSAVGLLLEAVAKDLGQSYGSKVVTTGEGRRIQLVPAFYRQALAMSDPSHPAFRLMIESMTSARDIARANGITFMVVLFPTKEEVYLPLQHVEFPSLTEPARKALEAEGIEVLDLTERLQERAKLDKKLFFQIDGHPNRGGNYVIAKTLRRHLQKFLAPPQPVP